MTTVLRGDPFTVTLERMQLYSGPVKNLHTDPEAAREHGLESPVARGLVAAAGMNGLLWRHLGDRWLSDGHIEVKFLKPVIPGDRITPCLDPDPQGGIYRVWSENQRGEQVAAGKASLR